MGLPHVGLGALDVSQQLVGRSGKSTVPHPVQHANALPLVVRVGLNNSEFLEPDQVPGNSSVAGFNTAAHGAGR